jgi:hypothetical protein
MSNLQDLISARQRLLQDFEHSSREADALILALAQSCDLSAGAVSPVPA